MDFPFDFKQLFPQSIIRVQPHQLRPSEPGCKLSQILDSMGQFSARAQGLNQPVTTAGKLAGDQVVYLITDKDAGRLSVTGLLKVGTKNLFLHDEQGVCRRCDRTPAILDFYVHETRQRRGQGKRLFERMLAEQGWRADKCSVDRPSDKLIGFLAKHYGLTRPIPQANNFVLYEGFFDDKAPLRTQPFSGLLAGSNQLNLPAKAISMSGPLMPYKEQGYGPGKKQVASRAFSSVAEIMGAGERISNRPGKRCLVPNSLVKRL